MFRGGTSLSKAFQVIDRFSEDIDITFTEHLGEARRKKLKYNILKPIADELGLVIRNFESIESDKNLNHYDFYYESVVGDRVINAISPYVKLEISLMSYAFPTEERELSNYLLDAWKIAPARICFQVVFGITRSIIWLHSVHLKPSS